MDCGDFHLRPNPSATNKEPKQEDKPKLLKKCKGAMIMGGGWTPRAAATGGGDGNGGQRGSSKEVPGLLRQDVFALVPIRVGNVVPPRG